MARKTRRQLFQSSAAGAVLLAAEEGKAQHSAAQGSAPTPRQLMTQLISGYRLSQMVHTVAKLGVAEQLRDGPRSVDEIAKATGTHADSLYRLLRTLAGLGVFFEENGQRFRLTPAAELLLPGVFGALGGPNQR